MLVLDSSRVNLYRLRFMRCWNRFHVLLLCWLLYRHYFGLWAAQVFHFIQYDFVHGDDCHFNFAKGKVRFFYLFMDPVNPFTKGKYA